MQDHPGPQSLFRAESRPFSASMNQIIRIFQIALLPAFATSVPIVFAVQEHDFTVVQKLGIDLRPVRSDVDDNPIFWALTLRRARGVIVIDVCRHDVPIQGPKAVILPAVQELAGHVHPIIVPAVRENRRFFDEIIYPRRNRRVWQIEIARLDLRTNR